MTIEARKICIITGTRAEYGLLSTLMREIENDDLLDLQVVVTAMHLEASYGNTVVLIERDGFQVDARVPIDLFDDSPLGVARSMAKGISRLAEVLDSLKPDILVLLGDRYEILGAAEAAMLLKIPIAHIHGGEATEGLIDESIRHSTTKMSHLHFTAAEPYRRRVIQLGENPERVFNVGAMCLDALAALDFIDRDSLSNYLSFDLTNPFFLVTYHPVTLNGAKCGDNIVHMLNAFEKFPEFNVIITGVNSDPGNKNLTKIIESYVASSPERLCMYVSLGQLRYFSAMKYASAVVGNSSSGILEAPALKVPTVNIGDRQRGRIRSDSVIDCAESEQSIIAAISEAIKPQHRKKTDKAIYPFGVAGASRKIKNVLKTVDLDNILMKPFYDLPMEMLV